MSWTPANTRHTDLIKKAFAEHGAQRSRDYVSYLAHPGIADFHAQRLVKTLEDPSGNNLHLLLKDGQVEAIVGIASSSWHSDHFGVPCRKIQPFFCFTEDGESIRALTENIRALLDRPGSVSMLRIEARQNRLAYEMTQAGFVSVGTSVRMVLEERNKSFDRDADSPYDTVIIRNYTGSDLPTLQEIIKRSHTHSHFFNECRFERERVCDLFAEWIRRCADGIAKKILVAETDGRVSGFCSLLTNDALIPYIGHGIGVIDFIAVDDRVQGKGIGRRLLNAGCSWFGQETGVIELRTMADNLRAIRFYEKNGFHMLSVDQYYHFWS